MNRRVEHAFRIRLAVLAKRADSEVYRGSEQQLFDEFDMSSRAVTAVIKSVEDFVRSGVVSAELKAAGDVFKVLSYGGQDRAYKYVSQVYGAALINRGRAWSKYVIQKKSVPKAKVKGLEQAAKVFISAQQVPRNIQTWVHRNEKNFKFLLDAKSWPEKVEGSSDLYKVDNFTVHNTLKLDSDDLAKSDKVIEASVKFVKRSGIPNVTKILYGDLFVVGKLRGHNTLAWYNVGDDNVYIRPMLKADVDVVHSLIHELGHRYWYKVLPRDVVAAWRSYHMNKGLEFPDVKEQVQKVIDSIRVGEPFPIPVGGFKRGGAPIVVGIEKDGNDIRYIIEQKSGKKAAIRASVLRKFLREQESTPISFPTPYASTSPEEHFAEAFSMYAMGKLTGIHKENFEKLVINS